MQFAFNQLTQRATFQARTVTVADGFELTDADKNNIANINQALRDYGLAAYASGDAEAISDYNTAELIYDPRAIEAWDANSATISSARADGNRMFFGRGNLSPDGTGPWTWSRYGAPDGSLTYANARFFPMTGRAMRAWAVAHEFGHLHSEHARILGDHWATEARANAFARKMTPHLKSAARTIPRVMYLNDDNY